MNIIFFLGKRQLEYYTLAHIKTREKYLLVALLFQKDIASLSQKFLSQFDAVHELSSITEDLLAEFDLQEVIGQIQNYIQRIHPNQICILCQDEANVLIAAAARAHFHLKNGATFTELEPFKDKMLMKQYLQKNNLRTPRFMLYDHSYSYEDLFHFFGTPFILKPTSLAASIGTYKISSLSDYENFKKEQKSTKNLYEAEEFIDGNLYHCDTCVKNKTILFRECSLYSCPNLDFQKGLPLGSIPLLHDDPRFIRLSSFATEALKALGMPDGCSHMELFINTKNEIVFLEVGARAPGSFLPKMYQIATGKNILDIDLQAQSGIEWTQAPPAAIHCFYFKFPIQKGIVKKLIEPKLESQAEMTWFVKPNDETKASQSNADFGAILFVKNHDAKALERDFAICSKHIAIHYE